MVLHRAHALLLLSALRAAAQSRTSSFAVPPLQWINLSTVLQGGSKPPPLKGASIGYDEVSRTLIIFGGESESGIPQSQTFLLDLQTLTWSSPSPPLNLQRSPSSRSHAVFGIDFAASNRHGFLVIGGRGSDGNALSDIWEYDFINQFWSEVQLSPGGPSPRWGASGGIDIRTPPVQDSVVPGPNNTFYIAGGYDGSSASPLSDVWELKISGTLSSNLPDSVKGSWSRSTLLPPLPGRVEQSGTVISQQIISAGGCASSSTQNLRSRNFTCALQNSSMLNPVQRSSLSPEPCPAPRIGSLMIPNLNTFMTSFASQVFLLLGLFNTTIWKDSDGHNQGEIAVLDTNTGTWSRVFPAGDPSSSGSSRFPGSRRGAAAVSFSRSLVGRSRDSSSDTIVFGGEDAQGRVLSDLWLLRSYAGVVTPTSPRWSGFGDGQLQSGIDSNGAGVRVDYLDECAIFVPPPLQSGTSTTSHAQPTHSAPIGTPSLQNSVDVSLYHKLFLPLSLVIFLPVILFLRWNTSSSIRGSSQGVSIFGFVVLASILAYALGVAGCILAFTTASTPSSTFLHLRTAHGISGIIFFCSLYGLVPMLWLVLSYLQGHTIKPNLAEHIFPGRRSIMVPSEKVDSPLSPERSMTPSILSTSRAPSPRMPSQSWDLPNAVRPTTPGGLSVDAPTEDPSSPPPRVFEVLNRPGRSRPRKLSGPSPPLATGPLPRSHTTRSLGDIDWLLRRRSLNAVGELDYVLTQAHNAQMADGNLHKDSPPNLHPASYPSSRHMIFHTVFQISILGLSAITLSALWDNAPRYYFAVFLISIIGFYAAMLIMAYKERPTTSALTTTIYRIRKPPRPPSVSPSDIVDQPSSLPRLPYAHHRPSYCPSTLEEFTTTIRPGQDSVAIDVDEDVDDDTRQRAMEEEMARRDVSIVTVPRRKLQIANPST